jgi:hypothetical protein
MTDDQMTERAEAMASAMAPPMRCPRGHSGPCRGCVDDLMTGRVRPSEVAPPPDAALITSALDDLKWNLAYQAQCCDAMAAGWLALLMAVEAGTEWYAAVRQSLAAWEAAKEAGQWEHEQFLAKRKAEYAETMRRHELAVRVECPYCGAQPGAVCRTAGPNGKAHTKGSGDHKDRYRAACHLQPDIDPEAGWMDAAGHPACPPDPDAELRAMVERGGQ